MKINDSVRPLIRKALKEHIKANGIISAPEQLIDRIMLELISLPEMERLELAAENRALRAAYRSVTR